MVFTMISERCLNSRDSSVSNTVVFTIDSVRWCKSLVPCFVKILLSHKGAALKSVVFTMVPAQLLYSLICRSVAAAAFLHRVLESSYVLPLGALIS